MNYTLPGGARQKEFWLFKHSLIAGWHYQRPSTAFSYYLDFFCTDKLQPVHPYFVCLPKL